MRVSSRAVGLSVAVLLVAAGCATQTPPPGAPPIVAPARQIPNLPPVGWGQLDRTGAHFVGKFAGPSPQGLGIDNYFPAIVDTATGRFQFILPVTPNPQLVIRSDLSPRPLSDDGTTATYSYVNNGVDEAYVWDSV